MNTLGRGFIYSLAIHCALVIALVSVRAQISLSQDRTIDLTLFVLGAAPGTGSPGGGSVKLTDRVSRPEPPEITKRPKTKKTPEPKKTASLNSHKSAPAAVSPEHGLQNAEPPAREENYRVDTGPDMEAAELSGLTGQATEASVYDGLRAGPGSGMAGVGDGIFPATSLDRPPAVVSRRRPFYPLPARRAAIEGRVEIKFLINTEGRVENVRIIEADPPGVFEESVRQTAYRWRFKPGTVRGKPVRTMVATTVRFELTDTP